MRLAIISFLLCSFLFTGKAQNSSLSDDALLQVKFDQKVGAVVPRELSFRDDTGRTVILGDYFHGQPTILVMGYYGCPMLCTLVLNGVMENLRTLDQARRIPYQVIFVSIDPKETPTLAAEKKKMYAHGYGGHPDEWHFLTGDEGAIRTLANAIGFRYAYDPMTKEYAHPSGFVILAPNGGVSRYFSGVTYSAKDLAEGLRDASAGKKVIDPSPLNLLCFHYAPIIGKYGQLALDTVRAGGVATVLGLGGLILLRKKREEGPR